MCIVTRAEHYILTRGAKHFVQNILLTGLSTGSHVSHIHSLLDCLAGKLARTAEEMLQTFLLVSGL